MRPYNFSKDVARSDVIDNIVIITFILLLLTPCWDLFGIYDGYFYSLLLHWYQLFILLYDLLFNLFQHQLFLIKFGSNFPYPFTIKILFEFAILKCYQH